VVGLFELSHDAFCIAGFDGYLRRANPAFARALGYTLEELLVTGADMGNGSGLVGLADRVEARGGRMRIKSPAGRGTSLEAMIPLDGT
jgi:PAS domain-containing protein